MVQKPAGLGLINWLALGVVVTDLVQEQFLDGVELFGPVEQDSRDPDVPAQGESHCGSQLGGQLEQPTKGHLNEEDPGQCEETTFYHEHARLDVWTSCKQIANKQAKVQCTHPSTSYPDWAADNSEGLINREGFRIKSGLNIYSLINK